MNVKFYEYRGREEESADIVKMFFPEFVSTIKTEEDLNGIDGWISDIPIDIKAVESEKLSLTVLRTSNGRFYRLPHYLTDNIDIIIVWFAKHLILRLNRKQIANWLKSPGNLFCYTDKNGITNYCKALTDIDNYIIGSWTEEGLRKWKSF